MGRRRGSASGFPVNTQPVGEPAEPRIYRAGGRLGDGVAGAMAAVFYAHLSVPIFAGINSANCAQLTRGGVWNIDCSAAGAVRGAAAA